MVPMECILDQQLIDFFWLALNEPIRRTRKYHAEERFKQIAKQGWAFNSQIEDVLDYLDRRLDSHLFRIEDFAENIGLHWTTVYDRPKARSTFTSGTSALTAADALFFFATLERMGFQTDASFLANLLLLVLKPRNRTLFTNGELEVFWFNKFQHKQYPVSPIPGRKIWWDDTLERIKTPNGYKVELKQAENDGQKMLCITAPKYRKRPGPVETVCAVCGMQWQKGDPDSSAGHRKEHKRRVHYLEPKPLAEFLNEKENSPEPELVTAMSPPWKHKEMYERALAFKREFHYDFIQWESPTHDYDPDVNGFLFADTNNVIVGACSFRKRTYNDKEKWGLQWIWVCPKERRNGYLSARWNMFRERFGDFVVEHPVSDEMQSFLEKNGDSALMRYD
jgi:hypothetical protein